jgi:predicted metal-binding membrane protein
VSGIGDDPGVTVHARASSGRVAGGVLAVAAVAWLAVYLETGGMQSAAGTMGLDAAAFVGLWTLMMAAMMLPALAPLSVLYAGEGEGRGARAGGLAAGYLLTWAAFGVLALVLSDGAGRLADQHASAARWAGAVLLVGAGIYQLTPLKDRCLALCRSPLQILMRVGGYRGRSRHVRAGIYHGGYCVGCCWSLMLALLALGVMNLWWMVAFTAVITLEKLSRHGRQVALATGLGLILLGLAAPFHPALVPGLQPPAAPMAMGAM